MAALLAYLASLKLWVLRRRHHAAPARAPAPEGSTHCNAAKHKQPNESFNITATAVASEPLPQNGSAGHSCTTDPDGPVLPGPPAELPSLPAASIAGCTPLPAGVVTILPSTALSPAFVQRLEIELTSTQHNKFVCLLLASMAREQLSAVVAARSAGDQQALAAAGRLCFAAVEAAGEIVAGAVFYPRDSSRKASGGDAGCSGGLEVAGAAHTAHSSKSAPPAACSSTDQPQRCCSSQHAEAASALNGMPPDAVPDARDAAGGAAGSCDCAAPAAAALDLTCHSLDPHIYVELIVSKQPGCGWGSLLLAAIEAHAARQPECRSVKLLSVDGAQIFYSKRGYSPPDRQHEMHKRLPLPL
ncbi:hypothetical protein ABPG77_009147 [Micractinium sp. CCAP 211/92]